MLLIFIIVSIVVILLSRGMKFRERITEFSKGAGQKDLLLMVWIFVLAGAFAASAKAMGAVDATVKIVYLGVRGVAMYGYQRRHHRSIHAYCRLVG